MDRGACWATVHGVAKSRTRLSDEALTHTPPFSLTSCPRGHLRYFNSVRRSEGSVADPPGNAAS